MELESLNSCVTGSEMENGTCAYPMQSKGCNNLLRNEEYLRSENSIFNMFLTLYAGFSIVMAMLSLFIEVLHGPIPLFYIHVYFYFYLLIVGIVILVVYFIYKHNTHDHQKHQTPQLSTKCSPIFINCYFQYGVIVFGLAALISIGLQSAAVYTATKKCMDSLSSSLFVLQCIFIVLEIPLLYQNFSGFSNMSSSFQKVAVMHLFCTNVSLWIHMLLWESAKEWQNALHIKHNSSIEWGLKELDIIIHSIESDSSSLNSSYHTPQHVVRLTSNCWWQVPNTGVVHDDITSVQLCLESSSIGVIWTKASEILYPFVIHFYFIAVLILYGTWKNILLFYVKQPVCIKNMCNRSCESVKGLCSGCFVIIASIAVVIFHLSFQIMPNILAICSCIIYVLAICSMLFCLSQMKSLLLKNASEHQNFMILIHWYGVYFIFLYSVFNFLSGVLSNEKYSFILSLEAFFMIVHGIVQCIYVVKLSELHIQTKDFKTGRQTVMLLILCNASLWIFEIVSLWNLAGFSFQFKVYGAVVWPIIKTAILPFVLLYRFYSIIITLEMWTLCQM